VDALTAKWKNLSLVQANIARGVVLYAERTVAILCVK
jgi:hypothetical protein